MSSLFLFQEIVLSKEKLKLEVIWRSLSMVTFFWEGGVVGFWICFFLNRAALLMGESCGCDLGT